MVTLSSPVQPQNAYEGIEVASSLITTVFNDDGTALYGEDKCQWTYDSEKDSYVLTYMIEQFLTIETENDLRYIETLAGRFYHIDDYEKAVAANQ